MLEGFKKFILRGNVVDMAVGVVIGAAFASVVGAFTKDLLTPLISALVGTPGDFATLSFNLRKSVFNVGDFINQAISFLLVAAAVYFFVITPINVLLARLNKGKGGEAAPSTKKCPECYSDIPIPAKRCAHCAQLVPYDRAA
ncbi:MAG TPA: large conductance mechanosensitive channel protein MscL [Terriglobales bacterium]|nr:large conductance mechanosensitive channel protein MscL [Terriglobales bacterium]